MAIVLKGIKSIKSVVNICKEHKISQALYCRLRNKFPEAKKTVKLRDYEKVKTLIEDFTNN